MPKARKIATSLQRLFFREVTAEINPAAETGAAVEMDAAAGRTGDVSTALSRLGSAFTREASQFVTAVLRREEKGSRRTHNGNSKPRDKYPRRGLGEASSQMQDLGLSDMALDQ